MVQIYNYFTFIHSCLFWWRSHYMFLDSEPEEIFQLPRSGMPLKEKKRTATLLSATEKIYMFLSSSPSVTGFQQFFFSLSRVAYDCQPLKFHNIYSCELHMQHNAYFVNIVYAYVARGAVV